jgi:RimJ/RimL family protein N-acetyltransferase
MAGEQTERFWMRPLDVDDIPVIALWFEHLGDLATFDRRTPISKNAQALKASWHDALVETEPHSSYWFAIDGADKETVGVVGLQDVNYVHGDAVVATFLFEPARRKGIGIRAGAMALDLAFDQLRLTRVTSYYRADNEGSRRLTTEMGLRKEGLMRKARCSGGQSNDMVVIGILREEWQAQRKVLAESLGPKTVVILGRAPWGVRSWPQVTTDDIS